MFKVLTKHPFLNGWKLFWLVSTPLCCLMLWEMRSLDMSTPQAVSHMIGYSVRWSIPFIYLVVAASAVPKLFPGTFSRWWGRNRKYFGLMFAVAMAWQGLFIFTISTEFRDYYFEDVYLLRDEMEGSIGYIFLTFMVLTSFQFGRKHLTHAQWKLLHTFGICFLWAYPFSVYWWNLFYYGSPEWHDYIFYAAGFLAFAARIAAWGQHRQRTLTNNVRAANKATGAAIIFLALAFAVTGEFWQDPLSTFLLAPAWSDELILWLPFWPFEPFLPLILLGIGTWLYTHETSEINQSSPTRRQESLNSGA